MTGKGEPSANSKAGDERLMGECTIDFMKSRHWRYTLCSKRREFCEAVKKRPKTRPKKSVSY